MPCPAGACSSGAARWRWLNPPDSSLVMATATGWLSNWAIDFFMSASGRNARPWLTPRRTRILWTDTSATEPVSG